MTSPSPAELDLPTLALDELLSRGRVLQAGGSFAEAQRCFGTAIDCARAAADAGRLAEALRWFAVVHQLQGDTASAVGYARQSQDVAATAGRSDLVAEALCTLGGIQIESGDTGLARDTYERARDLDQSNTGLAARIEGNLGILATIRGDLDTAERHYAQALERHQAAGNGRASAEVLHNWGMLRADRRQWEAARDCYHRAAEQAVACGDERLVGLCWLNEADADLATGRHVAARRLAERALTTFNRLNAVGDAADAYRVLGQAHAALGLPTLAESELRRAIRSAQISSSPLSEAESWSALAALLGSLGKASESEEARARARELFERSGAPPHAAD